MIDSIVSTQTTLARSRVVRMVYASLGMLWLGIAIVGIVVPLIPTTGPVLLAGFFFSRSSERFDLWLVSHRVFGPIIRDWRAGVGFSPRLKAIAVIAIVATFTLSVGWIVDSRPVRVGLVLFAIGLIRYILRLPTKR
ncbi:MAG TPA: DUF454 domain-containing protein [Actinobacteria bacterium]|nr:DUF454 domain-containing protein [Actinomycetota bacterium]